LARTNPEAASTLLLIKGPPAAGKSTLAARLVKDRPLALNLDIDVLRGQLGGWSDDPVDAGLNARRLALVMARSHLTAGLDVVVPQFLGKVDFVLELEALALETGTLFVEVMLQLDRGQAAEAFRNRSERPTEQTHIDAAALVRSSASRDPLGDAYDAAQRVLASRPNTLIVPVTPGDIDTTFAALRQAVAPN